jgi:predicted RNase H-like HicB family nuclease
VLVLEIPVIVEPHGGGWRARCRHPVDASATGDTRHEALQALEGLLRAAITDPVMLLPLEVTLDKPWIASAGVIPDDETTDAWLDAIAEYRRQRDADDQAALPPPPVQPVP